MIYTVTLNPALDYIINVPEYVSGAVNRCASEKILPGGKGINVSVMLNNMGVESKALGFCAGFSGGEIRKLLEEEHISTDFVELREGFTRINVKIKSDAETEINGEGPCALEEDYERLVKKLDAAREGDVVVLAGSTPPPFADDAYRDILNAVNKRGALTVLDASGASLKNALAERPFLVKPNHHELASLFGTDIASRADAVRYALMLQEYGARNVLVSMAEKGATLICEDGRVYGSDAPKGKARNSTGAGDSMVAGFVAAYAATGDLYKAFKTGIAAGSASAFCDGFASASDVKKLYDLL